MTHEHDGAPAEAETVFGQLPVDVAVDCVLARLPQRSLWRASRACRQLRRLCAHPRLWASRDVLVPSSDAPALAAASSSWLLSAPALRLRLVPALGGCGPAGALTLSGGSALAAALGPRVSELCVADCCRADSDALAALCEAAAGTVARMCLAGLGSEEGLGDCLARGVRFAALEALRVSALPDGLLGSPGALPRLRSLECCSSTLASALSVPDACAVPAALPGLRSLRLSSWSRCIDEGFAANLLARCPGLVSLQCPLRLLDALFLERLPEGSLHSLREVDACVSEPRVAEQLLRLSPNVASLALRPASDNHPITLGLARRIAALPRLASLSLRSFRCSPEELDVLCAAQCRLSSIKLHDTSGLNGILEGRVCSEVRNVFVCSVIDDCELRALRGAAATLASLSLSLDHLVGDHPSLAETLCCLRGLRELRVIASSPSHANWREDDLALALEQLPRCVLRLHVGRSPPARFVRRVACHAHELSAPLQPWLAQVLAVSAPSRLKVSVSHSMATADIPLPLSVEQLEVKSLFRLVDLSPAHARLLAHYYSI
eukprot:m51a1_g1741 hypothetical protein (550) ;mRNA; f:184850-186499